MHITTYGPSLVGRIASSINSENINGRVLNLIRSIMPSSFGFSADTHDSSCAIKESGREMPLAKSHQRLRLKPLETELSTKTLTRFVPFWNRLIKNIDGSAEFLSFNEHAKLSIESDIRKEAIQAGGHVLIQPRKGDVRLIPGKVDRALIEKLPITKEGLYTYSVTFYSVSNKPSGKIIFRSKENLPQETVYFTKNAFTLPRGSFKSAIEIWESINDIHHLQPMLERAGINYIDGIKSVSGKYAYPVDPEVTLSFLTRCQKDKTQAMIFVGNDASYLIYSGEILDLMHNEVNQNITIKGSTSEMRKVYFKVDLKAIASAWVVIKTAEDNGVKRSVTSLEFFNAAGERIFAMFPYITHNGQRTEKWDQDLMSLTRSGFSVTGFLNYFKNIVNS